MTDQRKAWTWRHAICKSDLPPTTRHVLHALSCWMNEVGGSCYPTTKELADATGLTERSVCTHLEKAESLGWLERRRHGFKGRGYRRHEYEAAFPGSGRGPETTSEEVDPEGENAPDALKEVQQVKPGRTEGGSASQARRTEPDDSDALKEVQRLRRPVHEPVQCSQARAGAPDDDARPDDDDLNSILLEAVGSAARTDGKPIGNLGVIRKWLDQDVPLAVIVEAVREKARAMDRGSLRSWRFMNGPIGDHVRDRKPDRAPGRTAAKPPDLSKRTARHWQMWVMRWLNGEPWIESDGPLPGEPGCLVPPDVIANARRIKGEDAIERRKARRP